MQHISFSWIITEIAVYQNIFQSKKIGTVPPPPVHTLSYANILILITRHAYGRAQRNPKAEDSGSKAQHLLIKITYINTTYAKLPHLDSKKCAIHQNLQYNLSSRVKKWITEAQNKLLKSKIHTQRPKIDSQRSLRPNNHSQSPELYS